MGLFYCPKPSEPPLCDGHGACEPDSWSPWSLSPRVPSPCAATYSGRADTCPCADTIRSSAYLRHSGDAQTQEGGRVLPLGGCLCYSGDNRVTKEASLWGMCGHGCAAGAAGLLLCPQFLPSCLGPPRCPAWPPMLGSRPGLLDQRISSFVKG